MTATTAAQLGPESRLLSRQYAATTGALFALCAFVAFEATAVSTIMPGVAAELHGISLYSLVFAAPLASGVVGMVGAGGHARPTDGKELPSTRVAHQSPPVMGAPL